MLLKTAIKKIETSKVFKDFKKENHDYSLAHAFTIIDKIQHDWQVGYYSKTKDKVVVFMASNEVTKSPEEEVFKRPGKKVQLLNMKKVKINLEKAVEKCESFIKKKYSGELINKTIVILQNLETEIYNITLVSHSLSMINIKIDASNGKIIKESRQSILSLKKDIS